MTAASDAMLPGRSALLLGATGLVGSECLEMLLADPGYTRVWTLTRRPLERQHPKLRAEVGELDGMDARRHAFRVDDVFCCLGTTMARAGSEEAFRRVDHDYVVQAAALAAEQGAGQFLVVSALGADPHSRIFYNQVKGQMEAAVKRLPLDAVWILRPSLLLGERAELRVGERVAAAVFGPLSGLMVGPLRRLRPVSARDVAAAMLRLAHAGETGGVVESEEIARLASG